jgi:hypothetical protein
LYAQAMQAPKLPALFSLFCQRGPRGFDYTPRYYDPAEEARRERVQRVRRKEAPGDAAFDAAAFRARMQHSWHRQGGQRASTVRLVVIMGLVCAVLFFIIKGFGLVNRF